MNHSNPQERKPTQERNNSLRKKDIEEETKKTPLFFDLKEFNIYPGEPVSWENFNALLDSHGEIIDRYIENRYPTLISGAENDLEKRSGLSERTPWNVRSHNKNWISEREEILEGRNRALVENTWALDKFWSGLVSFIFSIDKDLMKELRQKRLLGGKYVAFFPNAFQFEGVFYSPNEETRRVPLDGPTQFLIPYSFVEELISKTEPKEKIDFSKSIDELIEIAERNNAEEQDLQRLIQAIEVFGQYRRPEPIPGEEGDSEMGRCSIESYDFTTFCRKIMDIPVYTGLYKEDSGGYISHYHRVNLFNEKIVIDWTARQFKEFQDEPFPFIYEVGDPRIPKYFGKLKSELEDYEQD